MQERLSAARADQREGEADHFVAVESAENLAAGVMRDDKDGRRDGDLFAPDLEFAGGRRSRIPPANRSGGFRFRAAGQSAYRELSSFGVARLCVPVPAIWKDPRVLPCVRAGGRRGDGLRRRQSIPSTGSGFGICDWLFLARFRGRRRGTALRLRPRRGGRRLLLRGVTVAGRRVLTRARCVPSADLGMPCAYGPRASAAALSATQRRDDFALFFFEFVEDAIEIVPIETDVGCSAR